MNAQEAKNKAQEVNTSSANSQYSKIKENIKRAALHGEYYCYSYEYIKPDVQEKLTDEGYKVGPAQSERNEVTVKISWF